MAPIEASAPAAMVGTNPQPTEAQPAGASASAPAVASASISDSMVDSISERPQGIESLRDAIIEALKANPEIQIALARQDDARYGVHEAWSGYLPKVDMQVALGGDQTMLRRAEGVVTLNQNIWDFGTTINDIKRARATYRSAQWGTRERIEAISYEISAAYLTMLERTKLIGLTESEIAATQKILDMVVIQEDLGLTSSADVSRAKARFQVLQAELIDRRSAGGGSLSQVDVPSAGQSGRSAIDERKTADQSGRCGGPDRYAKPALCAGQGRPAFVGAAKGQPDRHVPAQDRGDGAG
jgi:outer membrane protein TolC